IEGGHYEMLLSLHARQIGERAHVAIIFQRGGNPMGELIDYFSRGIELNTLVGALAAKGFLEREISDHHELAKLLFEDRTEFQTQGIILGLKAHVVQFNVAADLDGPIFGLRHAKMYLAA